MLKIAICDDDKAFCDEIEKFISESKYDNYDIDIFYDGRELYDSFLKRNVYDLIFLDIEMRCMNGIDAGQAVRNELNDDNVQIAYISSNCSYAMELFAVRPIDFLIKPAKKEKIFAILEKTIQLKKSRKVMYEYMENHNRLFLEMSNIIYIEVMNRQIIVHTKDGDKTHYGKISDVMEKVDENFIQINRSMVINYNAIDEYKIDSIKMSNGDIVSVARGRQKEVQRKMIEYMGGV